MSRYRNIQDNKFKILLPIREERKQQSMKRKESVSLYEQLGSSLHSNLTHLRGIIGMFYNKDSAPRISDKIVITQEDIEKDLHEGRD